MRVLVDPDLTEALLVHLRQWVDVVAQKIGHGELEVGLLGSKVQPFARMELADRLEAWRATNAGAAARIVDHY